MTMAAKSTKKNNPRETSKKRNAKKNTTSNKTIYMFSFILLFAFGATVISYFLLSSKENSNKNILETKVVKTDTTKNKYEEITKEFDVDYDHAPKVVEKTKKQEVSVFDEQKKEVENTIEEPAVKVAIKTSKPKLVIIIDDVSSNYQINKAKEVGYPINLAFLPPTKANPNTASIAQNVPNHMIHLPLEASAKFTSQEVSVLNANDSYEKIEARIKSLRELYPKVKYVNNHTGSVFTQNEIAMDRLFKALKKYDFTFLDSRTTPKSVAKKFALKYDQKYYARNTFLDNEKNQEYIKLQLLKAIKIAKKNGFAIAIGHPYNETFSVLRNSPEILEEIEPVFINQL